MKCHKCEKEIHGCEIYSDFYFCKFCNDNFYFQPKRSKRDDFYQKLANEYLDSMEHWEIDPNEKISIECFASWLDRRCGALNTDENQ